MLAAGFLRGAPETGVGRPDAVPSATPYSRPPSVSLSIDTPDHAPALKREPPVVLPGYLLPVDPEEEPAHARG